MAGPHQLVSLLALPESRTKPSVWILDVISINGGGRQRPAGPFHFFETLQGPKKLGPGGPCRYLPRIKFASSTVILP